MKPWQLTSLGSRAVPFLFSNFLFSTLLFTLTCGSLTGCSGRVSSAVEQDAARETLSWIDTHHGVLRDPQVDSFMRRVVARLDSAISTAGREHESAPALEGDLIRYPWQVFVTKQPTVNAFSIGGGVILISRAMVAAATSEAEIAAIIAHEMSHQLLGHTREALSDVLSSEPSEGASAPAAVYSQTREIEADALSLKLLEIARYDTRHALYALMIGHSPTAYRRPQPNVASVQDPDQRERLARAYQAIAECSGLLPGTQTSREFQRVRARLADL